MTGGEPEAASPPPTGESACRVPLLGLPSAPTSAGVAGGGGAAEAGAGDREPATRRAPTARPAPRRLIDAADVPLLLALAAPRLVVVEPSMLLLAALLAPLVRRERLTALLAALAPLSGEDVAPAGFAPHFLTGAAGFETGVASALAAPRSCCLPIGVACSAGALSCMAGGRGAVVDSPGRPKPLAPCAGRIDAGGTRLL